MGLFDKIDQSTVELVHIQTTYLEKVHCTQHYDQRKRIGNKTLQAGN